MTAPVAPMSVVIPAYNAASVIHRQLDALAAQASGLPPTVSWELIVADNGSTDRTASVVTSYDDILPVRLVDASHRRGPGAARNIAAHAATGRFLVFTDADDVVADGWLQAWLAWAMSAPSNGFAAGPIVHGPAPTGPPAVRPCRAPEQMGLPYASANNLGIAAELFDRLGGFDETRWTGEDVDLSWRAVTGGAHIDCVPAAVHVAADRHGWALLRRYYQYGLGDPLLYRDHRAIGASREPVGRLLRTYGGLVARLPLLYDRVQRERWLRQLGRRTGRIIGSIRCRTWLP